MGKADEFIEKGNCEIMGYSISLEISQYENPKEGEKIFITGIEFGELGKKENSRKLLDEDQKKDIEEAKETGILEKERKK